MVDWRCNGQGARKPVPELRWIGRWTRITRHDFGGRLDDVDILEHVTRRYWLSSDGLGGYRATKIDGPEGGLTVRSKEPAVGIPFDGVWLDGERSPDTYVIVNGEVAYFAPAIRFSQWSFEQHEARGGGHAIP